MSRFTLKYFFIRISTIVVICNVFSTLSAAIPNSSNPLSSLTRPSFPLQNKSHPQVFKIYLGLKPSKAASSELLFSGFHSPDRNPAGKAAILVAEADEDFFANEDANVYTDAKKTDAYPQDKAHSNEDYLSSETEEFNGALEEIETELPVDSGIAGSDAETGSSNDVQIPITVEVISEPMVDEYADAEELDAYPQEESHSDKDSLSSETERFNDNSEEVETELSVDSEIAGADTETDSAEDVQILETMEIISKPMRAITPLPGTSFDKDQITTNVQTATGDDIKKSRAINVSQFMNEHLQSVTVNDYSGNAFRQDVNFRGFSASPLVATPQGLSVYFDGIRVNEAFGDIINWDLIPLNAIDSMNLIPGSNPLFGLNTLGGALSLSTKSGFTSEGFDGQVLAGSWGRKQIQGTAGYNYNDFAAFIAYNQVEEDGWRDNSPSDIRQTFVRLDYEFDAGKIIFHTMYADNTLVGNGTLPEEDYRRDPTAVYTSPDSVQNKLLQFQLLGQYDITPDLSLSMMGYRRKVTQITSNGDFWDDWDKASARITPCKSIHVDGVLDAGTGPGNPGCIPNGVFLNGLIDQDVHGFSMQLNFVSDNNQLVIGSTYDKNETYFEQSARLGWINDDREVEFDPERNISPYADALIPMLISLGFDISPAAADYHGYDALRLDIKRNELEGSSSTFAVFFYDVWQALPGFNISFGTRYSYTKVAMMNASDIEQPLYQEFRGEERCGTPHEVGGGVARFQCTEEAFEYRSWNPSLGLSWLPTEELNLFTNISRGTRTPSAIELGCARSGEDDPETGKFEGCTIPTALTKDPFLPQVVSISKEIGARGLFEVLGSDIDWNFAFFQTDLKDDILFTSQGYGNRGVFDTFGKTRRQGVEIGFNKSQGKYRWFANYTYLEATFESEATIVNPSNSSSKKAIGEANIFNIEKGDFMPGVPKHSLRAGLEVDITPSFTVGLNMIAQSSSFVRGNENNEHQPSGNDSVPGRIRNRDYVGKGKIPSFAILNLNASYQFGEELSIFLRVENLLDTDYVNAGNLGLNAFSESENGARNASGFNHNSNDWTHSTFVTPGAPRALWGGINLKF